MKKLLELGDHYVSDFIKDDSEMAGRKKYSLDLYLDEELGAPRLKMLHQHPQCGVSIGIVVQSILA